MPFGFPPESMFTFTGIPSNCRNIRNHLSCSVFMKSDPARSVPQPAAQAGGAPRPRRALVLEGGGAKGAYSFGALLAFKEMGITFDAVGGSSVGALNAVLWSSNCLEAGQSIWESISFDSVYPVKILDAKRYPPRFVRAVGIAYTFCCILWWRLAEAPRSPSSSEIPIRFILATLGFVLFCAIPYLGFGLGGFLFRSNSVVLHGSS